MADRMKEWLESKSLKLNNTKTSIITFYLSKANIESPNDRLNNKLLLRYEIFVCDNILKRKKNVNLLKAYYFVQMQSIIMYGTIFWGTSIYESKLFIWQKQIVRCMLRLGFNAYCRSHFKDYELLTVPSV